jgi:O-antigen/teichoic acid export membrane protein
LAASDPPTGGGTTPEVRLSPARPRRDGSAVGRGGFRWASKLLGGLFADGGTLRQRTLRGGIWVFASHGGARLLGIVQSVILARLLLPADFGLMSLAFVSTGLLDVLTEIGIAPALIHRQDCSGEMLDTAWLLAVLRGAVLCLVTVALAEPLAIFFGNGQLVPILQAIGLIYIISSVNSAGVILLQRDLEFRRLAYFRLASSAASLAGSVLAALVLKSVWALVVGAFVQAFVVLVGSYLIHPYRPRFRWDPAAARVILSYGKYILGGAIVSYLLTQGDNAVVGKFLGATALGYYNMAYNLSNLPATSITFVIGQVAFPAYAKLQNDTAALKEAYFKILKLTCLLALPMAAGLFAIGQELVLVLYGEKWLPMVPPFLVLCVYGLERAVNASIAPIFNAQGKPRVPFYLTLVKLAILAVVIYPLTTQYGILGTSVAQAIAAVAIALNALPVVARTLQCPVAALLRLLAGPFAAAGLMVMVLVGGKALLGLAPSILSLLAMVLVGAMTYFFGLWLFDRGALRQLTALVAVQLGDSAAEPNS